MSKKELIERMAKMGNMTIKEAEAALELVLDVLKESLRDGKMIPIRSFGSFGVKSVSAREGRNPSTGEKISIPAKKRPYWKPAKDFLNN
jgi:integration host factor subunit beta